MGAPKAKMVLRGHRKHISGLAFEADMLGRSPSRESSKRPASSRGAGSTPPGATTTRALPTRW